MEMKMKAQLMERISLMVLLTLSAGGNAYSGGTSQPQTNVVAFTAACDGTEQRYVLMLPANSKADQPRTLRVACDAGSTRRVRVRIRIH